MYEWSDTDIIMRDAVRGFIDKEIRPHLDGLESGELSPYPIARKLFSEFGLDVMAAEAVKTMLDKQRAKQDATESAEPQEKSGGLGALGAQASMAVAMVSELAGVSIGLLSTVGVSIGLGAATIMSRGTLAQKERWLPELMTFEKIAAWAITEPDAGSDAFGGMKTYVKRDGADYMLNGQKTFITNGPYADVLIVYAKLDDGEPNADKRNRPVLTFVLDAGMPGLTQGKPFKKMGMMSSPTGELFFDNVRLTPDRLLGETEQHAGGDGRDSARANFVAERVGIAAMSLGIINECHRLCVDYAKTRTLVGQGDRAVPADPAEAGQDGGRPDERAEHGVQHAGTGQGGPTAVPGRGVGDQAVLIGGRDRRGDGRRAAVRWQRLHGRVPGRAARPGREVADDLCRQQRSSDHAHREGLAERMIGGKVVAITGGARGIGRATGEAFLRAGARVALGDVDVELVEKTAAELAESTGGEVCGLALDVTNRAAFARFLDDTEARLGPLDVLVNNAGIMPTGMFAEEDDAMTDRMLAINLCGVLYGSKLAAARLAGRGGHIVNVASLAGAGAYPGLATYCATKHAVVGFSEALHLELADAGIGVTAILPGVVHTELSAGHGAPRWTRPLTDVEPNDVATAIVGVVGTDRTRRVVPRRLGVVLKTMALLPDRSRHRLAHAAHLDTAFTNVDPQVRESYHRRIV